MEIEFQEIADFLSRESLFADLSESFLHQLMSELEIQYLRRGSEFPPIKRTDKYLYIVRSGAIDCRDNEGQLLDRLSEGDLFNEQCQQQSSLASVSSHASEDSLLYAIPCDVIDALRGQSPIIDRVLYSTLNMRIRHASNTSFAGYDDIAMQRSVESVADYHPLIVSSTISIKEAAALMSEHHSSSLLVVADSRLIGLVSDSDLRKRCLAGDISRHESISKIMTADPICVTPQTVLSQALIKMTRHQIHHLPVLENDKPVAMLGVNELMHYLSTNPAYLASDIEKAQDVDRLVQVSRHLPELQVTLAHHHATAEQIGEVISSISDAITVRLLQLAERQFGEPPVPYVWLAGGSQGRHEQTSHSDQDNALFIDDSMQPVHADYYSKLSRFVSDGLNACGYVYCPGDAMATNDRWRQPVKIWLKYFAKWIEQPEKKALMLSSIFFDLRPVYGEVSLFETVQKQMLTMTQSNQIFIAYLVSNALTHRPPLGFFRNLVVIHDKQHDRMLDLKHRGIVPIVDIARVFALQGGIKASATMERLKMAAQEGLLSEDMSENLQHALEYIGNIRIQHQANQYRQGLAADNYLDPDSLSQLQRGYLKDAFQIIKTMQEVLANRYQTGRLS